MTGGTVPALGGVSALVRGEVPDHRRAQRGPRAHRRLDRPAGRSGAPNPGARSLLHERRVAPEPHAALAAAHPVDVLVLLPRFAAARGDPLLSVLRVCLPGAAGRLADDADAVPGAHLPDQPARARHAGRKRRRLDALRAHRLVGPPAARAAILRRRRAGQPAAPARDDRGRARRSGGDGPAPGQLARRPHRRRQPRRHAGGLHHPPAARHLLLLQRHSEGRADLAPGDGGPLRPLPEPDGDLVRRLDAGPHDSRALSRAVVLRAGDREPAAAAHPLARSSGPSPGGRPCWRSSACTSGFRASSTWASFPGR